MAERIEKVNYTDIDLTNEEISCSSYTIGRDGDNNAEVLRIKIPPKFLACRFVISIKLADGSVQKSVPLPYNAKSVEYKLPGSVLRVGEIVISITAVNTYENYTKNLFERSFVVAKTLISDDNRVSDEAYAELFDRVKELESKFGHTADFDESDENSPSYIANRPLYTDYIAKAEIPQKNEADVTWSDQDTGSKIVNDFQKMSDKAVAPEYFSKLLAEDIDINFAFGKIEDDNYTNAFTVNIGRFVDEKVVPVFSSHSGYAVHADGTVSEVEKTYKLATYVFDTSDKELFSEEELTLLSYFGMSNELSVSVILVPDFGEDENEAKWLGVYDSGNVFETGIYGRIVSKEAWKKDLNEDSYCSSFVSWCVSRVGIVNQLDAKYLQKYYKKAEIDAFNEALDGRLDTAEDKLEGIESGAQVNNIEKIATSDGTELSISNKKVTLPAFILNTVNDLENYYLKREVYTKNEIAGLIGDLHSISINVVEALPEENIAENVIYFVPAEDEDESNVYEEYIRVNDDWELIGTTAIDLTGYATEEWVKNTATEIFNVTIDSVSQMSASEIYELFKSGTKIMKYEGKLIIGATQGGTLYYLDGTSIKSVKTKPIFTMPLDSAGSVHKHSNLAILEKFSDSYGSGLKFNNKEVATQEWVQQQGYCVPLTTAEMATVIAPFVDIATVNGDVLAVDSDTILQL